MTPTESEAHRVSELVCARDLTVAVAESMTGGALTEALVETAGSGEWLAGGLIAYASRVKREMLNVRAARVISADAVREMAVGVARLLETDVGIATSGCAGPARMEDQPVGTTFIGVSLRGRTVAKRFCFGGDALVIRDQAVCAALHCVRALLEDA